MKGEASNRVIEKEAKFLPDIWVVLACSLQGQLRCWQQGGVAGGGVALHNEDTKTGLGDVWMHHIHRIHTHVYPMCMGQGSEWALQGLCGTALASHVSVSEGHGRLGDSLRLLIHGSLEKVNKGSSFPMLIHLHKACFCTICLNSFTPLGTSKRKQKNLTPYLL